MKYRDFGRTGIKVSEIGFGSRAIGSNEHGNSYGATDDKTSLEAIHRAIDLGCNFFDTADAYGWGHSEELLGKAFKGKRDHLIIATKVGADFYQGHGFQTFTEEYIRFALDKSLKRLKTDYVDVYQLHNPPLKLIGKEQTYSVLNDLKKEGKVRAWGISIFDPIEGRTALSVGKPDSLQVAFNVFNSRPYEELLQKACAQGCAIIAREPLSNGFLTGKYSPDSIFDKGDIRHDWPKDFVLARIYAAQRLALIIKDKERSLTQLSLQYVLANPAVSVVIPGMKTHEHAEENCKTSDGAPLTEQDLSAIRELQSRNFGL